ncbi:hypothetical protein ZWY2020_052648 [Hordeum vulgare]|nr:hypothetical protein ZWY2020_052648 [Hordeum vulgare]
MVEGQSRPSRAEKLVDRRTKARHDPATRARMEEPASEAAPRHARRTDAAKPSEPDASTPVDLEEIPESSGDGVAANAPELNLDPSDVALDAPEVIMDASDAANPPPAVETAPAGTSVEPIATLTPGDGIIFISNRGPAAPGAGPRAGSRPMKAWRATNLERQTLPAGTILQGVPELVSLFANSRYKVEQAARVASSDLERLEERTRAADGQVTELQARLGEGVVERDALREADDRHQQQLALLQAEKNELEAARQAEQEQLRASLQEKDNSHAADMERLEKVHLEVMKLKDAALKEKEEALIQRHAQLAKALDTTAALQEEVTRITQASKVRELEALESAHETDGHFDHESSLFCLEFSSLPPPLLPLLCAPSPISGLFPETRDAAERVVEVSREERHMAGQEVDVASGWSVEEIGVGLRARLRALGDSMVRLQVVGSSMLKALWPDGVEPASMSRLSRLLAAGDDRLDAWCALVARAGA